MSNPAVSKALAGQEADFDLRLIQPASVCRCVVDGEAVPQGRPSALAEMIHQRLTRVGTKIVHHQMDRFSLWIMVSDRLEEFSEFR